jgi:hypothetical protein
MSIGLIKHGEERRRGVKVGNGQTTNIRREKYCVKHSWIDLFLVPELHWYRIHFNCDKEIETSAAVEQMKAAA